MEGAKGWVLIQNTPEGQQSNGGCISPMKIKKGKETYGKAQEKMENAKRPSLRAPCTQKDLTPM